MNSVLREILAVILGIVTWVLTFLGVIVGAIIAWPDTITAILASDKVPIGQWSMVEVNLQAGRVLLLLAAAVIGVIAGAIVWAKVGDH